MQQYRVEIRQSTEKIPNGIWFTVSCVIVNARTHPEAKSIAEVRHKALVLSTEVAN